MSNSHYCSNKILHIADRTKNTTRLVKPIEMPIHSAPSPLEIMIASSGSIRNFKEGSTQFSETPEERTKKLHIDVNDRKSRVEFSLTSALYRFFEHLTKTIAFRKKRATQHNSLMQQIMESHDAGRSDEYFEYTPRSYIGGHF